MFSDERETLKGEQGTQRRSVVIDSDILVPSTPLSFVFFFPSVLFIYIYHTCFISIRQRPLSSSNARTTLSSVFPRP